MDLDPPSSVDTPTSQPSSGMPSTADSTRLGQGVRETDKPSSSLSGEDFPDDYLAGADRRSVSPVPTLREAVQSYTVPCGVPSQPTSNISLGEIPSPVTLPQAVLPRCTAGTSPAAAWPHASHQNGALPIPTPRSTSRRAASPLKQGAVRPLPIVPSDHGGAERLAGGLAAADREMIALLIANRGGLAVTARAVDRASGGSGMRSRGGQKAFDPKEHEFGKDGQKRMIWVKEAPARYRSLKGKDKLGFASLPPHLLRYIFTMALEDATVPPVLERVWSERTAWPLVVMVLQRRWLATMRLVCIPWMHAANVHPFWIRWLYAFAPTCFSSDVAQLYSMADQLSGPFKASHPLHRETSRPQSLQEIHFQPRPARTALSIARAQAPRVCVPCRINRLNSQHVPKADRNYATWTPMFGSVGVCWGHVESWCHHCLRDDQLIALDDYGRKSRMMRPPGVKDLNIYPSKRGDTDDEGRGRRTESDICVGCRLDAIQYQLEKVVEQCAAGGPIRAKEMVYELPQTTTPGRSYVDWGRGTARLAAVRAVEEKWLTHQARWAEMCEMAVDVQKTEQSMRELLRNHGELGRDGSKFTTKRAALLAEMHGDEDGLEGNWWMGYQWELAESMTRWKLDWQQGAVDEEYDVDDEDFEAHELSERWWLRARQTTMLDWVRDRIKYGFWISPADEVLQLNSPPSAAAVHEPIERMAQTSTHPCPGHAESDPRLIYAQCIGYIRLEGYEPEEDDDGQKFLPPPQLLIDLEALFAEKLTGRLEQPFTEIVEGIMFDCGGDVEKTWTHCRNVNGAELLQKLREQPTWSEGGIVWSQRDQSVAADTMVEEPKDELGYEELLKDAEDDEEEGELFDEPTPGPRIEMLQVEPPMDEDNAYGITEVTPSSSMESDHELEDDQKCDSTSLSGRSRLSDYNSESVTIESEDADAGDGEIIVTTTTATTTSLGKRKDAPEGDELLDQRAGKERKSESPKVPHPAPRSGTAHDEKDQSPALVSPEMPAAGIMSESGTRGTSETSSTAVPKTPDEFADDIAGDTVDHVDIGTIRKDLVEAETSRSDGSPSSDDLQRQRGSSPMSDIRSTPEIDGLGSDEEYDGDGFDEEDEEATPPPVERAHAILSQMASRQSAPVTLSGSIRVKLGEVVTTVPRPQSESSRKPPSKGPRMYLEPQHVPWIPANFDDLGPGSQGVIMKAWENTWRRVASCHCDICVRGEAIQIALTD